MKRFALFNKSSVSQMNVFARNSHPDCVRIGSTGYGMHRGLDTDQITTRSKTVYESVTRGASPWLWPLSRRRGAVDVHVARL